ncbi:MAG TPA: ABC transporter ATP-binding protein [Steroidobacteraceae bacterium]|jgi:oligopeptide transport system ATP-binding protein|nr:ABC transporter ATP-binding protein [Steroidobacteraceae bacterium]
MRSTPDKFDGDGDPLLAVSDLSIGYPTEHGEVAALRGVSLDVVRGECLGVVGESGSGKTQLLLATLGLLSGGAQARGSIRFRGQELLHRPARELDRVRGRHVAMVFQDPLTALNPYVRVGIQITEGLQAHQRISRADAKRRAVALLESLRMTDAAGRMRQYPHELSGGMRQRIVIAMALINEPDLLLADEPTTALDVTVQAQILSVFAQLRARTGTAILLVTHDLGVIARLADRVVVMYAGRVVEQADVQVLFERPMHPYTEGLILATPRLDEALPARLATISGTPPSASAPVTGCAFAARCRYRMPVCESSTPELLERDAGHWVACHRNS